MRNGRSGTTPILPHGDEAERTLIQARLTRLADSRTFQLKNLGDAAPVITAGGIFAYARQTGMLKSPPG